MNFLIDENDYFILEHCYSCAVSGYLILSPTITAASISELPYSFQAQLGPHLASATHLIQETLHPLKIYCAHFGEERAALHFHLFPRTSTVTSAFLKVFPDQKALIHGPVLLDWARAEYHYDKETVWAMVLPVVQAMRKCITTKST